MLENCIDPETSYLRPGAFVLRSPRKPDGGTGGDDPGVEAPVWPVLDDLPRLKVALRIYVMDAGSGGTAAAADPVEAGNVEPGHGAVRGHGADGGQLLQAGQGPLGGVRVGGAAEEGVDGAVDAAEPVVHQGLQLVLVLVLVRCLQGVGLPAVPQTLVVVVDVVLVEHLQEVPAAAAGFSRRDDEVWWWSRVRTALVPRNSLHIFFSKTIENLDNF